MSIPRFRNVLAVTAAVLLYPLLWMLFWRPDAEPKVLVAPEWVANLRYVYYQPVYDTLVKLAPGFVIGSLATSRHLLLGVLVSGTYGMLSVVDTHRLIYGKVNLSPYLIASGIVAFCIFSLFGAAASALGNRLATAWSRRKASGNGV